MSITNNKTLFNVLELGTPIKDFEKIVACTPSVQRKIKNGFVVEGRPRMGIFLDTAGRSALSLKCIIVGHNARLVNEIIEDQGITNSEFLETVIKEYLKRYHPKGAITNLREA